MSAYSPMINYFESAQVLEKNHFPGGQNRSTVPAMREVPTLKPQIWLLLMAIVLMLAVIAPVAVLAA